METKIGEFKFGTLRCGVDLIDFESVPPVRLFFVEDPPLSANRISLPSQFFLYLTKAECRQIGEALIQASSS